MDRWTGEEIDLGNDCHIDVTCMPVMRECVAIHYKGDVILSRYVTPESARALAAQLIAAADYAEGVS